MTLAANGSVALFAGVDLPGAWVITNQVLTDSGRPFTGPLPAACRNKSWQACQAALGRMHLRQLVVFQPGSRYWDFQWLEAGIFLALALALAGLCFWLIRRLRLA